MDAAPTTHLGLRACDGDPMWNFASGAILHPQEVSWRGKVWGT